MALYWTEREGIVSDPARVADRGGVPTVDLSMADLAFIVACVRIVEEAAGDLASAAWADDDEADLERYATMASRAADLVQRFSEKGLD